MHLKRLIVATLAATMLFSASAFAAAPDVLRLDRPELALDVCYAPTTPAASIEMIEAPGVCLAMNEPIKIRAPNLQRLARLAAFMDATGQPPIVSCPNARASPPT